MNLKKLLSPALAATLGAYGIAWAATQTLTLGTSGGPGGIFTLFGSTSGSATIQTPAAAGTATIMQIPAWAATGNVAAVDVAQTFSKPQRTATETPAIATSTFTPVFSTANNHRIVLVNGSCPCTLANPAAIVAGQAGVFEIVQSATGSDTIGTWGSEYAYVGGTSAITLSTGANVADYIPYYVDSSGTVIILGGIIKGAAH